MNETETRSPSDAFAEEVDLSVGVGESLLGRVIDALGRPLDGGGPVRATEHYPLYPPPLNPMARDPVSQPLPTGVRAIDGMLTSVPKTRRPTGRAGAARCRHPLARGRSYAFAPGLIPVYVLILIPL